MIRIEHNVSTGEIIEIEMTAEEIVAHNAGLAKAEEKENAKNATKQAVLDKLGLSAEEVAALLN